MVTTAATGNALGIARAFTTMMLTMIAASTVSASGREAIDQEQQSCEHLANADKGHIATADHAFEQLAGHAGRHGPLGKEIENVVGSCKDHQSAEQEASDDCDNSHGLLLKAFFRKTPSRVNP